MVRLLLLMASTTLAGAVDDAGASDSCSKLSKARAFSLGYDVYAGTMISGDRAFAEVLRRSDRVNCFTKIMSTGSNEAKMYALVALRELSSARYQTAVKHFKARPFTVIMIATKEQGVLRRDPSKTVIARIDGGEYRSIVVFWLKHELPPKEVSVEVARKQFEKMRARLRRAPDSNREGQS